MGERYARILAALPDCTLVAVSDLDRSRAQTVAGQVVCEVDSADALLRRADVDAVCVCTPESTHVDIACAVLAAGKDLLVEKPLARTAAEARRIATAAADAGRIATVGHLLRFEPHYAAVHGRIQGGALGDLQYALAWRESTRASAARYVSRSSVPLHLMVHDIDLMRWFSGAEVRRIHAASPRSVTAEGEANGSEAVSALLEMTNGMTTTLVHSWALSSHTPSPLRAGMRLVGTRGELAVDFSLPAVSASTEEMHTHLLTEYFAELPTGQFAGCLRAQIEHFVHCVATRTSPLVSLRDGLRAVEIAEGIQQAVTGARDVMLPLV
jgi:UDP-N-acetylglucosamine 3-dehydrogenase